MPASTDHASRQLQARRDSTFLVLAGLFLGTLGMLNILGLTRFLQLGHIGAWPIVVAIGALPYPITFLCTDLISELWGESQPVGVGGVTAQWLGGAHPLAWRPIAGFTRQRRQHLPHHPRTQLWRDRGFHGGIPDGPIY